MKYCKKLLAVLIAMLFIAAYGCALPQEIRTASESEDLSTGTENNGDTVTAAEDKKQEQSFEACILPVKKDNNEDEIDLESGAAELRIWEFGHRTSTTEPWIKPYCAFKYDKFPVIESNNVDKELNIDGKILTLLGSDREQNVGRSCKYEVHISSWLGFFKEKILDAECVENT